ncbi:unnamed protein product [Porites evermanni]|uniref:Mucin-like protein n=1 Tax=Porites evermanni TaxID=104178 RepID=A0ABN8M592_9CNID|nr:unnamed protein product [Porites evermanni]
MSLSSSSSESLSLTVSSSPSVSQSSSSSVSTSYSVSSSSSPTVSQSSSSSESLSLTVSSSPSVSLTDSSSSVSQSMSSSFSESISSTSSQTSSSASAVSLSLSLSSVSFTESTSTSSSVSYSTSSSVSPSTSQASSTASLSASTLSLSSSISSSASFTESTSISPSVSYSISWSVSPSTSLTLSRASLSESTVSLSLSISSSVSFTKSISTSPSVSDSISSSVSPPTSQASSTASLSTSTLSLSSSISSSASFTESTSTSSSVSYSISWSFSPSTSQTSSAASLSISTLSLSSSISSASFTKSVSTPSTSQASSTASLSTSTLSLNSSISSSASFTESTSISPSVSYSISWSVSPSTSLTLSRASSSESTISLSSRISSSVSFSKSIRTSPSVSDSISSSVSPSTTQASSTASFSATTLSLSSSISSSASFTESTSTSSSVSYSISWSFSPSTSQTSSAASLSVSTPSLSSSLSSVSFTESTSTSSFISYSISSSVSLCKSQASSTASSSESTVSLSSSISSSLSFTESISTSPSVSYSISSSVSPSTSQVYRAASLSSSTLNLSASFSSPVSFTESISTSLSVSYSISSSVRPSTSQTSSTASLSASSLSLSSSISSSASFTESTGTSSSDTVSTSSSSSSESTSPSLSTSDSFSHSPTASSSESSASGSSSSYSFSTPVSKSSTSLSLSSSTLLSTSVSSLSTSPSYLASVSTVFSSSQSSSSSVSTYLSSSSVSSSDSSSTSTSSLSTSPSSSSPESTTFSSSHTSSSSASISSSGSLSTSASSLSTSPSYLSTESTAYSSSQPSSSSGSTSSSSVSVSSSDSLSTSASSLSTSSEAGAISSSSVSTYSTSTSALSMSMSSLSTSSVSATSSSTSLSILSSASMSFSAASISSSSLSFSTLSASLTSPIGTATLSTLSSSSLSVSETSDIDDCASGPCHNGATCLDGVDSFNCTCPVGFVGDVCNYDDPCLHNPCKNNGTCYVDAANNYTFFCVCPIPKNYEGQDCGEPVQCFWDIMYPYGEEQGDREMLVTDVQAGYCIPVPINPVLGFYFFGIQHFELFICANGMIRFDAEFEMERPIPTYDVVNFPFDVPMLTPYWSRIDYFESFCAGPEDCTSIHYVNRSVVYYQTYTKDSQTQMAAYILGNASEEVRNHTRPSEAFQGFSASWVLVVTWLRLRPEDFFGDGIEEELTNTFQAVIITNGTYSFVKYHYPCGAITWSAPPIFEFFPDLYDGYPVAGFNAGDFDFAEPDIKYPSLDSSGTPEVKELDDHLGNTDRRGEYFFRIEDRQGDDATAQCFIWHDYQTSNMQSQLQNAVGSLTSCPCSFWQAFFDTRFLFFGISKGDWCFTSVTTIFINTDIGGDPVFAFARQKCCYSFPFLNVFNSFLTLSFVDRPDELLDDETAERLCCDESNNCDLYYEVRPLDFCDDYFPILRLFFFGDPHINTLDGKNYTFNGLGEYTMTRTMNDGLVLQARTKVAQGGLNTATIFSAGAAKEANTSKVEVRLKDGGGLEMLINGTLYPGINNLTNISRNVGGNLQAKKNEDNCTQVIFPSGSGVDFCVSKGMMSFVVALDTQYYNKTKGLLGTFNENKDDDFTLPNGTVLSPSITAKQIHYDFGLKWQITAEESLFTYGPGENVSTFQNESFVPMFVEDIVWADNNTQAQAEANCGGDIVCLFDAASTNDVSIGLNSQAVKVKVVEENKQLNNFPPKFTYVPKCIEVTLGEVAFVNVTASDNDSFTFSVLNIPNGANISSSGNFMNFTWNVTSAEKVKFSFVVTDEFGAASSSTPCIKMCACTNGGQCVSPKVGDKYNNDSKFIYQGCACSAGYTGRFCESDIDACKLNGQPCFKGSTCTDLKAPANITGFQCGPCPSGYSGNGIKCVDINECANGSIHNCAQQCTNTPGSFVCSCNAGFTLNSNKYSCDDINECEPTNDCMHKCNNTIGNYTCYCNDFFEVNQSDSKSCVPSNPCSDNNCNQVCYRGQGDTQSCDCFAGYQLNSDGKTCEDIDECKISGVRCTQECKNLDGSYECKCFSGYKLEANGFTCTDINECLNSTLFSCPGRFRVCKNTPGSYMCECQQGLLYINNTCQVLKVGEKLPDPTVASPKSASPQEIQNSVEMRVVNMLKEQYNATVDQQFRGQISQTMDERCSENKVACGLARKRRRRALGIFTADNVHLLPDFPVQDNSSLRIAFYVLLPSNIQGGAVIPAAILLQVVNTSKSALEAVFGSAISGLKLNYVATSPAPNATNMTTPLTTPSTTQELQTTKLPLTDASNDDWKWIVIGVILGALFIVIIAIVIYFV